MGRIGSSQYSISAKVGRTMMASALVASEQAVDIPPDAGAVHVNTVCFSLALMTYVFKRHMCSKYICVQKTQRLALL